MRRRRVKQRFRSGYGTGYGTTAPAVAPVRSVLPVLLCALAVAVCGCSSSTPQRAVEDFISARMAGDGEKAAALTVEEDLAGYPGGEPYLYAAGVDFELEPPQTDGDRAVVVARFHWDGQSVDIPYVTRRIGTKWKVALGETQELWLPDLDVNSEV